MNNIIKEFSKQSGIYFYGLGVDKEKFEGQIELFAELIVQECISYIDSRDYFSGSEGIAEHFGVK